MSAWEKLARHCEKVYGVLAEYDEDEFFVCPECGEPIYKDDWRPEDFVINGGFICPVCEESL